MNGSALIFMIIAMVLIWGGLIVSIIHLVKHPDISMAELERRGG